MTQDKWVFDECVKGTAWDKIVSSAGKSASYKGLQDFFTYAAPKVGELQTKIASLDVQARDLQTKVSYLDADYSIKLARNNTLDAEFAEKLKLKDSCSAEVSDLEAKRVKLQEREAELYGRGITIELVEAIVGTDADAVALVKRVETAQKSDAEEKQLAEKRRASEALDNAIADKERKLDSVTQTLGAAEARLADVRQETRGDEESIRIVKEAIAEGYSAWTIRGVFRNLHKFALPGAPNESVKRLIESYDSLKALEEIGYMTMAARALFEQTRSAIATEQGKLEAAMGSVIPTLNKATTEMLVEFKGFRVAAEKQLEALSQSHQGKLTEMLDSAMANVTLSTSFTLGEQEKVATLLNKCLIELSNSIKNYEKDITKWGKIREESGKLESALILGNYLQSLNNDPKLAVNMDPSLAVHMVGWVTIWCRKRLPEARTLPPEHVKRKESGLPTIWPVGLVNIMEWVLAEFQDLERRGVI